MKVKEAMTLMSSTAVVGNVLLDPRRGLHHHRLRDRNSERLRGLHMHHQREPHDITLL